MLFELVNQKIVSVSNLVVCKLVAPLLLTTHVKKKDLIILIVYFNLQKDY